jgi:hypothetical protein
MVAGQDTARQSSGTGSKTMGGSSQHRINPLLVFNYPVLMNLCVVANSAGPTGRSWTLTTIMNNQANEAVIRREYIAAVDM